MSSFQVIVTGENWAEQLQPFHRFENTGDDDEHVKTLDVTLDIIKEYREETAERVRCPDGSYKEEHDEFFWRIPTNDERGVILDHIPNLDQVTVGGGICKGIRFCVRCWDEGEDSTVRICDLPEGFEKVVVPHTEAMTLLEYAKREMEIPVVPYGQSANPYEEDHAYGWIEVDEDGLVSKIVERTNPNAKWAQWCIGGRYSDQLIVPEDCTTCKRSDEGPLGSLARMLPQVGILEYEARKDRADSALIKDVKIDAMRERRRVRAHQIYDEWADIVETAGRATGWIEVLLDHDHDRKAAQEVYNKQPLVAAYNAHHRFSDMLECPIDLIGFDRDRYVDKVVDSVLVPWAFLHNGEWKERGVIDRSPGCPYNELDEELWFQRAHEFIESLDPETRITIIDCRI